MRVAAEKPKGWRPAESVNNPFQQMGYLAVCTQPRAMYLYWVSFAAGVPVLAGAYPGAHS